jgi:hypothetical protein
MLARMPFQPRSKLFLLSAWTVALAIAGYLAVLTLLREDGGAMAPSVRLVVAPSPGEAEGVLLELSLSRTGQGDLVLRSFSPGPPLVRRGLRVTDDRGHRLAHRTVIREETGLSTGGRPVPLLYEDVLIEGGDAGAIEVAFEAVILLSPAGRARAFTERGKAVLTGREMLLVPAGAEDFELLASPPDLLRPGRGTSSLERAMSATLVRGSFERVPLPESPCSLWIHRDQDLPRGAGEEIVDSLRSLAVRLQDRVSPRDEDPLDLVLIEAPEGFAPLAPVRNTGLLVLPVDPWLGPWGRELAARFLLDAGMMDEAAFRPEDAWLRAAAPIYLARRVVRGEEREESDPWRPLLRSFELSRLDDESFLPAGYRVAPAPMRRFLEEVVGPLLLRDLDVLLEREVGAGWLTSFLGSVAAVESGLLRHARESWSLDLAPFYRAHVSGLEPPMLPSVEPAAPILMTESADPARDLAFQTRTSGQARSLEDPGDPSRLLRLHPGGFLSTPDREAIQGARYRALVPGPSDLVHREDLLILSERGDPPVVCCNVTGREGEVLFLPSLEVSWGGLQVAVIGVSGEGPDLLSVREEDGLWSRYRVVDPAAAVRGVVDRLSSDVDGVVVAGALSPLDVRRVVASCSPLLIVSTDPRLYGAGERDRSGVIGQTLVLYVGARGGLEADLSRNDQGGLDLHRLAAD